jgi:predicted ATPase
MRGLAVLVALFQRLVDTPVNLAGLEEPEIALHPAAAGVLFDAMREASQSVQVIATTHSADLLDKKEIDTDAILAVEMLRGTTRIGGIDETGRVALKERLYSAGELMRMNYLRPQVETEIESDLFGDLVTA